MNLNDITLGDLEKLRPFFSTPAKTVSAEDCACEIKTQIVILNRGWVVVGRVRKDRSEIIISSASVIRLWGTTKGLGEIASSGPTSSTKLDPCPDITAHELAVVGRMDCDPTKWATHVK